MLLFVSPLCGQDPFSPPLSEVAWCPTGCCTLAWWVQYSLGWGFGAERSLLGGFRDIAKEMGDFTEMPMSFAV